MTHFPWQFFRAGGVDQVLLTRGEELGALDQLDQKLWVALSCPVKGLSLDARGLSLLDTDQDGRIRAPELIEAGKWVVSLLRDPDRLVRDETGLPLSALDETSEEARQLQATASALLASAGKTDDDVLTLADARAGRAAFEKLPANGDGVVPPAAATDDALRAAMEDLLRVTPAPKTDASGAPGLDRDALTAFQSSAEKRLAWLEAGRGADERPLGDDTAAAFDALLAIAPKIDDFFTRVRIGAFDERALAALNRDAAAYEALAARTLPASADDLAEFPLAKVAPAASLPLGAGVNPAFAAPLARFRELVVVPVLGPRDTLDEGGWAKLQETFAAHRAWRTAEPASELGVLDEARLKELSSSEVQGGVLALIEADEAAKPRADAIERVEKLVWLHDHLFTLANNYVAFRDFYARKRPATFQAGTLYLDQRACSLCLDVLDGGRHATLGAASKAFLVYCDLKNETGEKRSIVAAVTEGDTDHLIVGRNGLFYDREGNDWDATITRIVDNPISVRQACFSPYKKLVRLIEEQVSKRAAAAEKEADGKLADAANVVGAPPPATPPPAPAAPKKIDVGVVAALGVAVGGITAALGMLLDAFFGLGWLMPFGVIGLLLAISGPSMAVAWLKLRQRNLGPLLDANGWAINTMARVNVPLGRSLTAVAALPKGAKRDLRDPYRDERQPVWAYALALVLVAAFVGWYLGALDDYLPESVRRTPLLGDAAPDGATPDNTTPPVSPEPAP